ncbi:MAG: elongation factor P [Vicinamibacterales bacterium]
MADNLLATQLRKGMIVKIENKLYRIFDRQHVTPGNLRGFVRVKMRNIQNGVMAEEKLRSEDIVERVSLEQKKMQYLYSDNEGYHFMDTDTYDQVQLQPDLLGDMVGFLKAEMNVEVEFYGENPIGIELPQTVDLIVTQTMPAIKGATATNQTKPATLETGVVIQVPPFIGEGDVIRVNTETGEYQTRA